jgi:uncharacterized protein (TIGR02679 family)
VLTLRQLRRHQGPLTEGLVRVCENPIVVAAAADELGPRCPPVVCVNGRPSGAVWTLLDVLAASGARFAYHGDFDWGGIGIASAVYERVGWQPWRYDTAAYEAVPYGGDATTPLSPLTGRARPTPWDPALSAAMERRAVRVEEELVLGALLTDLSANG